MSEKQHNTIHCGRKIQILKKGKEPLVQCASKYSESLSNSIGVPKRGIPVFHRQHQGIQQIKHVGIVKLLWKLHVDRKDARILEKKNCGNTVRRKLKDMPGMKKIGETIQNLKYAYDYVLIEQNEIGLKDLSNIIKNKNWNGKKTEATVIHRKNRTVSERYIFLMKP